MKEFGEKLSDANKKPIEDSLEKLKAIHKEEKIDEIDAAVENLNKAWEAASQEIYKATQEQQGAESATSNSKDGKEDKAGDKGEDISDVDFEEVKDDKK